MKRKVLLSIGIPVYNENANIRSLINSILAQKGRGFILNEIIIISDGSTDETANTIKSFDNKKIKFFENNVRMGKSYRLNEIFKMFTGEILFLLDGDIKIKDNFLFENVILRNDFEKSGLVGITAKAYASGNNFQKIVQSGLVATYEIAKRWKNGNNYLAFKGCFLALNGKFAKRVIIDKQIANDDAYLYFSAIENGYFPTFFQDATIYFNSPKNFSDHLKQASRFKKSKDEMQKYFNFDLNPEYDIPLYVYFKVIAKLALLKPYYFLTYIILGLVIKFQKRTDVSSAWSMATTTKE